MALNTGEYFSLDILEASDCLNIVKKTLQNETEFDVVDFKFKNAGSDILGYMGEYYNLRIVIKQKFASKTEYLDYFVKTLPLNNLEQRKFVEDLGLFKREMILYSSLFQDMDKHNAFKRWHGNCYHAREDILVLEDLTKSGYQLKPPDVPFSQIYIETTLRCAARMNANSIAFENQTGRNIENEFGSHLRETQFAPGCGWTMAGVKALKSVISVHPKYQKTFLSENFDKYLDYIFTDLLQTSTKYRNVFCHRDLWDKNILFKYSESNPSEPIDCVFLDFQISRYHPPAIDILQFLYWNTTPKQREKGLDNYLQFYYACLVEEGQIMGVDIEKEISREEFFETCDYFRLVALISSGVDGPIICLPDDYMNNLKVEDPARYNLYTQTDRTELVCGLMKTDAKYKDAIDEIVEEVVENMIKRKDEIARKR